MKSKKRLISFPVLLKSSDLNIVGYYDTTYVSLKDGSSQGGFIIFIWNNINKMALIFWSAKEKERKKLDCVMKSSLTPETYAHTEATETGNCSDTGGFFLLLT